MSDSLPDVVKPEHAVVIDRWPLAIATAEDIDQLMGWFADEAAINLWGGPGFRFPFTRESFHEDVLWTKMASYCLRDPAGRFIAFGQFYDRVGRINLARLVVHSASRGQGAGKRLIISLMTAARPLLPLTEFSLFVYEDNTPAFECYKSLGFVVTEYPGDMLPGRPCLYLTRPVSELE